MDLISLYYFVEAAKDLHITNTANRLYMSQQTLSNHILRVEDHYGVKLFHRRPRLQLTSAGREILRFAEQVRQGEVNLKDILADAIQSDIGEIILGASSPRFNYYLPDVLKAFSARYPNVTIDLIDQTSEALESMVQKNQVDFAVTVDTDAARLALNVKSEYSDPVYFCVSDRLLRRCYGDGMYAIRERAMGGARLADFAELPFLILSPQGRMGRRINECFQEAGYAPRAYLKATHTTIMAPLCNAALAGCFTSHMNLSRWRVRLDDDVNILPLTCRGRPVLLNLQVVYNKQRYLNHHCRYFLDLLDDQFSSMAVEELARLSRG